MLKKSVAAGVLAVGLVFAGSGVAAAHECYVPGRSDQGNAGASHSANWYTLTVQELFSSAHNFVGGAALTPAQVQIAVDMAADAGIPSSFTVFERFTLPVAKEGAAGQAGKSTDGKGIDHFFEGYGDQLLGIFFEVRGG